jgi:hypothetical protein
VDKIDFMNSKVEGDNSLYRFYKLDKISSITRLINILRSTIGPN